MPAMSKEKFDEFFSQLSAAQCPVELWWMVEKLNQLQPKSCLEIGGGHSSFFWGFFAPTISLTLANYSTSNVPHVPQEFLGFEEFTHYHAHPLYTGTRTFICDSHRETTLAKVKEFGTFDFLFIDGDHRPLGVQQDIEMYFPLVNPGGLVAFHDWDHMGTYEPYGDCYPVRKAFENLGMVPTEVKSRPTSGYAIATYQL